jgi:hypothetical protein
MTETPYKVTTASAAARKSREVVYAIYKFIYVPILILGAAAFLLTTMLNPRGAIENVCYSLALASWLLVIIRFGLLLVITATAFPAFSPHYMAPAHFMLVCGAIFSCAAWLQIFRYGRWAKA